MIQEPWVAGDGDRARQIDRIVAPELGSIDNGMCDQGGVIASLWKRQTARPASNSGATGHEVKFLAGKPAEAFDSCWRSWGRPRKRRRPSVIKAIPRRQSYLSCRCAVIVDIDNIRIAGEDTGCRPRPRCWREVNAAAGISMGYF